jgi:DNA-binding winged helix-turn-helix (wHTH) protein
VVNSASLAAGRQLVFDAFRMDVASHRLWRGDREIPLRPKSWDVLRYLLGRPGLLVTKEALHAAIWPDAVVSDDTLTKSIGELRRALGDTSRTPRFIETVHGRGFRFVAEIRGLGGEPNGPSAGTDVQSLTTTSGGVEPGSLFVGRQAELLRLHECLRRVGQGERQLVFITGEAGIGKTALAEAFVRSAAVLCPDIYVLHGQCIQQHGPREPYMPVLEALERLLSSPVGRPLLPLFRQAAPCWYAQTPSLQSEGEPGGSPAALMNAPAERMLREGASFLESVSARSTVLLVLEDLHWSDSATVDLLSYIAQRRGSAPLLIVATYRPAEASIHEHPIREVRQTLRLRRRCIDLPLDFLSAAAVQEYLKSRFGDEARRLAPLIHERTDGNPLFVVAIVDELLRRGQLAQSGDRWVIVVAGDRPDLAVPNDVLETITSQVRRLSADQRAVLEAASVAGVSFDPQTVARALGRDAEGVDAMLRHLAESRLFLTRAGRAQDHRVGTPYAFAHALHHQVIYEQLTDTQRRRLHRTIGETLETAYGERAPEIAAELSNHFERGDDPMRAVTYLSACVARAQQRFAHREAIVYAEHALASLARLPGTPQRHTLELEVRMRLAVSLCIARGYAVPEVSANYDRAHTLCEAVGDARQLFEVVHAAWYARLAGTAAEGARQSVDELARIAEDLEALEFRWRARLARGRTELWSGNFGAAVQILTHCVEDVERQRVDMRAQAYGADPIFAALAQCGIGLWFLGRPEQARAHVGRGLARAQERGHPFDLASGFCHSATIELFCGSTAAAADLAMRAATICADKDVAYFRPISRFLSGAALAARGEIDRGLREMLQSLAEQRAANGLYACDVILGFIAAAYGRAERWDEGLRRADEGIELTETTLERVYAAELWRVRGELLLGKASTGRRRGGARADHVVNAGEQSLRRALEIARQQEARSLALRTATSLARLSGRRHASADARELLGSIYASFTEGFDTKDLVDAKALLNQLRT